MSIQKPGLHAWLNFDRLHAVVDAASVVACESHPPFVYTRGTGVAVNVEPFLNTLVVLDIPFSSRKGSETKLFIFPGLSGRILPRPLPSLPLGGDIRPKINHSVRGKRKPDSLLSGVLHRGRGLLTSTGRGSAPTAVVPHLQQ